MARIYYVAPQPPLHTADGASYNTSVALTDVSPLPPINFQANQLEAGSEIELNAAGEYSTTVTPTLLLGFYYGGVAGVALAASAAITTGSTVTGVPWQLWYRGTVRTIGATGSIQGQGRVYLGSSLTAMTISPMPITKAARTVTIDTTAAKSITVGAQWGTSSASNIVICTDISVKLIT